MSDSIYRTKEDAGEIERLRALAKAVRSFERADTEFRSGNSGRHIARMYDCGSGGVRDHGRGGGGRRRGGGP